MKGLRNLCMKEYKRLEKIAQLVRNRLVDAPDGHLRVSINHKSPQYYHCIHEKRGKYIKKENRELARKLAQKSYDLKILALAEKRLKQLERILKDYEDNEIENVYLQEHPERQKLILSVEPTWEQRLEQWKSIPYNGKSFTEGYPVIMSERGERVRSKSEKIMADYFFRHGIEYKYECPVYLHGVGMVYPDFTFLSRKTGKEIYWEHNGMMDSPEYAGKAIRKIHTYEKNGIYPGENLILTFETEQIVLNTDRIEQLVKRYL